MTYEELELLTDIFACTALHVFYVILRIPSIASTHERTRAKHVFM